MKYPLEIASPATEPLTLQEAKDFFREDRSIEDALIEQFVGAARKALQQHTGYFLVDTEMKMYLGGFEDVNIPKKPLKSGSVSIQYVDEAGATKTRSESAYNVHEVGNASVAFLDVPALNEDEKYPVIITFTVGYGATEADVPSDWKSIVALIAMILWRRDIPEDEGFNPLEIGVVRMHLKDYKIGRFK